MRQLGRIAGFVGAALLTGNILESADRYINLNNRLRAVTNSLGELQVAEQGVIDIARKTYTSVEDSAQLFQRYAQVTDHLGLSQNDVIDFTHRLTQAMKLGGSTAAETRGALIQLGQGIGTNFQAGGQEIRSIQEQSPILADILAKAAGGTRGELMQLAKAGKLSGKVVVKAMRDAGEALDKLWLERQRSFEDMTQSFDTEWLLLIKQMMPAFDAIIRTLEKLVIATRKWVEEGEALNSFMAGAIVIVMALTSAFSGLALAVIAVLLPWAALFIVIEDFVTFMRGGDSLIGRFFDAFDPGGANVVRRAIQDAWAIAKKFFAWLQDPKQQEETWKNLHDSILKWVGGALDSIVKWVGWALEDLELKFARLFRNILGETLADTLGVINPDDPEARANIRKRKAMQRSRTARDNFGQSLGGSVTSQELAHDKSFDSVFFSPNDLLQPPPRLPGGLTSSSQDNRKQEVNVTVQGNATPETAREVGRQVNYAFGGLGPDRSDIGDAVGVAP